MTADNNAMSAAKARINTLILLAMAIPFVAYFYFLSVYLLDMPYWDDFSVIVWRVGNAITAENTEGAFREMLALNNGHLPVVTRLIAFWQAKLFGTINFKAATIFADAGMALTTVLLVAYFRKTLALSWLALLPLPFFLLTLNHWEALDFMTPAWQMYWGSVLLPVICLLAITESRNTVAVFSFTVAIFLSSGSISLYPVALACYLFRKQWLNMTDFAIRAGLSLAVFFYLNPPQSSGGTLNIPLMLKYVPAFMGNLVSTGVWDMSPIAWLHITIGIFVILLGLRMLLTRHAPCLAKLVFIYILLLAAMAAFLRGPVFAYVVSRYSMFASLSAACIYIAYAAEFKSGFTIPFKKQVSAFFILLPVLIWVHSIYVCRTPLQLNMEQRLNGIQAYINEGDDPNKYIPIVWDFAYGKPIMDKAKMLGIYNPAVLTPLITPKP